MLPFIQQQGRWAARMNVREVQQLRVLKHIAQNGDKRTEIVPEAGGMETEQGCSKA